MSANDLETALFSGFWDNIQDIDLLLSGTDANYSLKEMMEDDLLDLDGISDSCSYTSISGISSNSSSSSSGISDYGSSNFESGSTLNLNLHYTSKTASLPLRADESAFAEDDEYDDEKAKSSSSSSLSSGLIIVPTLLTISPSSKKVSDQTVRNSSVSKSVVDKSDAAKKTSPPRMTLPVPSALGEKRAFSGAMGLNDSTDKAKLYKNAIRSEKLGKLENVVGAIVTAINSFDTKLLEHLVHEFVRFDCTKVSSLNDHLLKPSGCTLAEPPSYMSAVSKSTLNQSKLSFLDRVESVYNSTGNLYLLYGTGSWIIDYDPESLDVIKFEMKYALTSFKKQLQSVF